MRLLNAAPRFRTASFLVSLIIPTMLATPRNTSGIPMQQTARIMAATVLLLLKPDILVLSRDDFPDHVIAGVGHVDDPV